MVMLVVIVDFYTAENSNDPSCVKSGESAIQIQQMNCLGIEKSQ